MHTNHIYKYMAKKDVNRLKIMLAVTKHSNKWLAEMLGKDQATISKWCTNTCQPDLETLIRISDLLKVDVNDLLNKECSAKFGTPPCQAAGCKPLVQVTAEKRKRGIF